MKFSEQEIQRFDLGSKCEVFYHPKWMSFKKALKTFDILNTTIPFKQHRVSVVGTTVDQPRLTCWFGDESYTYSGLTINPAPWTQELLEIRDQLRHDLETPFNSVLANFYKDGSSHVGWHADNEDQIGSTIASVSLGGLREFGMKNPSLNKHYSIELQTGSLLVMAGETQKHCKHCIVKTAKPVEPRINLTFRVLQ